MAPFCLASAEGVTAGALGLLQSQYSLASLRYNLSKLRAKHLLEKLPHSRRYRLAHKGYFISVLFLELFERIYAPLTGSPQAFRVTDEIP